MALVRRRFVGIEDGDTFSSYEELKSKIEKVQEETKVPFLIRDCVTLVGALKTRPNVASMANSDLVYHSIHYICVCGKNESSRRMHYMNRGVSSQYLSKVGERCRAEIKVGLSEDFQRLKVKRIIDLHNHKISPKLYKVIIEGRKLNSARKSKSSKAGTHTKLVGEKRSLNRKHTCPQRFKDNSDDDDDKSFNQKSNAQYVKRRSTEALKGPAVKKAKATSSPGWKSNYGVAASEEKLHGRVGFKRLVEEMYKRGGSIYEVFEEGLVPQSIFFQTDDMRRNFAAYPEAFIIDSSFKIPELSMTLYAIMNANGNGECTIVSFFFVVKESENNLKRLMNAFVLRNPACSCVKVVMLDKEFCDGNTVLSKFPNASRFTCYHHAVQSFQKEIYAPTDIGFENEEERDWCFRLFKKMALAKDHKIYSILFDRFRLYAPAILYNSFILKWHRTLKLWVDGLKSPNAYFLNQRHNRLDAIDQILKSVCDNFSSVSRFLRDLLKTVSVLHLERQQRALEVPVKGPVITSEFHIAEMQYQNLLTPYAFTFVRRQLHSSAKVVLHEGEGDNKPVVKSSKYGDLATDAISCPCVFHVVTGLPCSHVFAVRRNEGLPTYEPSLCSPRWTLHYLRRMHNLPDENADLVPDALFGLGEFDGVDAWDGEAEMRKSDECIDLGAEDPPFVPLCLSSSVNIEAASDQELEEEIVVVDEVDPDFDFSVQLCKDNSERKESDNGLASVDWIGMLRR